MKRLFLIAILIATTIVAPFADASCTGHNCGVGGCYWYEILIDTGFASPSCNAWNYTGTGGTGYGAVCNSNQPYGTIPASTYLHGGTISQAFVTNAAYMDQYNFQYTIETSGMTSGDYIKVYVQDINTASRILVDTISADTWCNNVSHSYTNPGWLGHSMSVKFESYIQSTSTTVKITGVNFWQRYA